MWFYRNRFPFFSPLDHAIHHFLSILADVYEKEGMQATGGKNWELQKLGISHFTT